VYGGGTDTNAFVDACYFADEIARLLGRRGAGWRRSVDDSHQL